MNLKVGIALLVVGAGAGMAVSQILHAQGTPPAFSVTELGEIDMAKYQPVAEQLTKANREAGGKQIVRGGKVEVVEGEQPGRVVITQWKSVDEAKKFYNSDLAKKLFAERKPMIKRTVRTFVIEGLPN